MTGFSEPNDGVWINIGATLNKYGHLLAQSCGGLVLGISLALLPDYLKLPIAEPTAVQQSTDTGNSESVEKASTMLSFPWILLPLGILGGGVFSIYGTIASSRDTNKLSRKAEKLEDLEANVIHLKADLNEQSYASYQLVAELFDAYKGQTALWLTMASQELNFNERHRITIYRVDKEKGIFAPLFRYSKGPKLNDLGRRGIPVDKCAISSAYEHGRFFCNDIPDPITERQKYNAYLKENFGYTQAVINKLNMHSRSLAGFSVLDERSTHYVGVVVFESLDNDLNNEKLQALYNREQRRVLSLIEEMQRRGSSLDRLKDRHLAKGEEENEQKAA